VDGNTVNAKSRMNISHLGMSDLQKEFLQPIALSGYSG
jgi:hypothetical protein